MRNTNIVFIFGFILATSCIIKATASGIETTQRRIISLVRSLYGRYNIITGNLEVNANFANGLEVATNATTIQATALLMAITTFHGRDQNQLKSTYNGYEAGWTFEMNIDPNETGINKNNAVTWIEYYPYRF